MTKAEREWVETPFTHGHWGVAIHYPGKYPEWFGEPRWSEQTARVVAARLADGHRRATILRNPPGTRFYAIPGRTTREITLRFDRILQGLEAAQ